MASGIFWRTARHRAISELIERDAFLYHYRNKISFEEQLYTCPTFSVYRMASAVPNYFAAIAIDHESINGKSECIKIGLGASASLNVAIRKASNECLVMIEDHGRNPNWCASDLRRTTMPDFHHRQSRNSKNRFLMQSLCTVLSYSNRKPVQLKIVESRLVSPIPFFKLLQVKSNLTNLTFGNSEPHDEDMFHPIW